MTEYQNRGEVFKALGIEFDLFEGIYGSTGWDGMCQFLELEHTPICCAVAKNHRLAGKKQEKSNADSLHNKTSVLNFF